MPRRSQDERSQETRWKACEATLDALVEVGYERISTPMIASKAGISRGALTHQFPKRDDLLVAAFLHLVDGWRSNYPFRQDTRPSKLSIEDLIEALWKNIFEPERYAAAAELMLASRQNNGLGQALRDVLIAWIEERDEIAIQILGVEEKDQRAKNFMQLTLSALRGIAMHRSFDRDALVVERQLSLWKEVARRSFSPSQF
jgi:AcrR family transcriptional regulator